MELCWALYYLIDDEFDNIPDLQNMDMIYILLENFKNKENIAVVAPSMRIIGNMLTGSDSQQSMILECDLIIALAHVIEHTDFQIRKDAVWLSSNLLAGPPENIDRCIDAGLVSWLLEILIDNSTGIKDNDISVQ